MNRKAMTPLVWLVGALAVFLVFWKIVPALLNESAQEAQKRQIEFEYSRWIAKDGLYQWMNIPWEASPKEIEAKLGQSLEPVQDNKKYYTIRNTSINPNRYKVLSGRVSGFLGSDAKLIFIFIDQRLFSYDVFIAGQEPAELDQKLHQFVVNRFGETYSLVNEENNPLRAIWNLKNTFVNYWFYKDTLSLSLDNRYWAGFGVVNRSLENAIQ